MQSIIEKTFTSQNDNTVLITKHAREKIEIMIDLINTMNLKQSILAYEKKKKRKPIDLDILKLQCWLLGLTLYAITSTFLLCYEITLR